VKRAGWRALRKMRRAQRSRSNHLDAFVRAWDACFRLEQWLPTE
jgi:hypothetical protein